MLESLSVLESVGVAGFVMGVVFSVLFGVYLCVRLFSLITMKIENIINSNDSQKTN